MVFPMLGAAISGAYTCMSGANNVRKRRNHSKHTSVWDSDWNGFGDGEDFGGYADSDEEPKAHTVDLSKEDIERMILSLKEPGIGATRRSTTAPKDYPFTVYKNEKSNMMFSVWGVHMGGHIIIELPDTRTCFLERTDDTYKKAYQLYNILNYFFDNKSKKALKEIRKQELQLRTKTFFNKFFHTK